jgi:amidase
VVGLKPTHGLVPYTGIVGIDNTFDHACPMSRNAAAAALTLEVIAGKDPLTPGRRRASPSLYRGPWAECRRALRIGVLAEGFGIKESDPDVDEAVRKALAVLSELGVQTTQVSVPGHIDTAGIV